MASLKARKVIGSDFEALLEMDEPEADQAVEEVVETVLTHFQDALEYVLSVGIPSSDLTNLVAQFRSQAVVTCRF